MKKIIVLMIASLLLSTGVFAQNPSQKEQESKADLFFGPPVFLYDVYFFKSSSDNVMTRTEISIGFCNDILQFIKEANSNFHASYEIVIAIFDKKGNHLSGKTISDEINVSSFPETNLRKITNRVSHTVELVADEYKIIIELTDLDTKKTLHREKTLKVREFRFDNVGLSDIVFADDMEKDSSDIESIIPNLNRSFNNPESYFGAYFEIYPMTLTDSLTLIYTITDATDKPIVSKVETHTPNKFIVPYILYLKDQISRASRYNIKIEVKQKDKSEKIEAKFSTSWRYFKFTDLNVNQAIGPLKDFVTSKDWNWIQQASDSAKEEWYKNYWKERDPTPDTEENELMLEFYDRVDFANYHFLVNSLDMDGWETDRGKIYIKYGRPTNVDRRAGDLNVPPYEIWFYSSIERRFIFEDRSGMGDYTLVKIE